MNYKDRNIKVIGDLHLGHVNILKFMTGEGGTGKRLREFDSIQDHDDYICDRWNDEVEDTDIVYVLGDVGFRDFSALRRLKGRKRLILGNHDNPLHPLIVECFGKKQGVWRMFPEYSTVLTHVPLWLPSDEDVEAKKAIVGYHKYTTNIHGHTHDHAGPTDRHFCVSCERINYTPVNIQDVLGVDKIM